ncbi:MAG: hypothetical protein K0U93_27235 [Gammaproteobacteria bacterium]|nr:hypothetical protein [Gammaproteobacteria bacterium]
MNTGLRFDHLVPDDWTPEQALAAFDLANALAELIWQRYDRQMLPLLANDTRDDNQLELPLDPLEDTIPF